MATYLATNELFLSDLGWRRAFWGPGLLLVVIAGIYAVLARERPRDVGLTDLPQSEAPAPAASRVRWDFRSPVLREVMADGALWATGVMYFFTKMTRYAFLFWLPLYMTEALRYTDKAAGYTSSVYELVGILGVLAAGYASDKLFQARRFPVGAIMLYGLAVALFFHPTLAEISILANAISIGVIGIMERQANWPSTGGVSPLW